jgi:peptide/nickel transport system permease protein
VLGVHILPNAITPIIVATTVAMGRIILAESGLSFLGIGIQPPATSWGSMLSNAQELIGIAPRLAVLPGLLILTAVVSINFLGDGLQSAFDPRSSRRQ